MPILDHLSEEITDVVEFHSFHNAWATQIAYDLNEILPKNFRAKPHAQLGIWEVDVRTDQTFTASEKAKLISQYQSPCPSTVARVKLPTELEVFIINVGRRTQQVVGVIEIVSRANKDRADNRMAFVAKCHSLLAQGISLAMIDILAIPVFNLHNQLLAALEIRENEDTSPAKETPLYCSAYRVLPAPDEAVMVEFWEHLLSIGDELPELPLFITSEIAVPIRLERSYMEVCRRLRIIET
ncbi:DUF4058 family protein [Candidatus Poribacteria bacterium]|nr:DUF4058 family protein [Candidatus Poribacteria bacterium]